MLYKIFTTISSTHAINPILPYYVHINGSAINKAKYAINIYNDLFKKWVAEVDNSSHSNLHDKGLSMAGY